MLVSVLVLTHICRYKSGSIVDIALEILGNGTRGPPNPRDLDRLDLNSPTGKKLSRFFEKVRVGVRLPSCSGWREAGRPIATLVPEAGFYELNKGEQPMTVQVCSQFLRIFGLMITRVNPYRNTSVVLVMSQCNIPSGSA